MTEGNSDKNQPSKDNSVSYFMFILGVVLLIVGIYLSTYTTVIMVESPMNFGYLGNIDVPHPEQVQPYLFYGVFSVLSSVVFISLAFYRIKHGTLDLMKYYRE